MIKMSTGQDSTLGNWRKMTAAVFGDESEATKFLDKKIAEHGENEEVLVEERQLIYALATMDMKGEQTEAKIK